MTDISRKPKKPAHTSGKSTSMTIPANEVGVTLTISNEALEKIDKIQEQYIKAAQEDRKVLWR